MLELLLISPVAFLMFAVAIVIAFTIHEFAHAFVADQLGDPTPRIHGRVTLNPLAHLDPLGTLALLLVRFGWGKPVPFDPYNLKNPVRDAALIAIAGPLSNLFLSLLASILMRIIPIDLLQFVLSQFIYINIMLAIFNLVPIYPLDGSKILPVLLPKQAADEYQQVMEQYGNFILLAMLVPWINGASAATMLISPAISFVTSLFL